MKLCDNETIEVHRYQLEKASKVFGNVIAASPEEDSVDLTDMIDIESLRAIVMFLYTGEVMDVKRKTNLLLACRKFEIPRLYQIIKEEFVQNICDKNALRTLMVGKWSNDQTMKNSAIAFIQANQDEVFASDQVRQMLADNIQEVADVLAEKLKPKYL